MLLGGLEFDKGLQDSVEKEIVDILNEQKSISFAENENDNHEDRRRYLNSQILTILTQKLFPLFLESNSQDLIGFEATKKRFTELELSLKQLSQSQSIPTVRLDPDERIAKLVAAKGPNPSSADMDRLITDSSFLNKLQQDVNTWIKEIQKVTMLTKDPHLLSTRGELEFWLDMEKGLCKLEEGLRGDTITLTLSLLKRAKRFHATVSFLADTGLKDALDTVFKYNILMKDFPLSSLLTSTSLTAAREAINDIFAHINKKLRISPYPIARALLLAQALSKDLKDKIYSLLTPLNLIHMAYPKFGQIVEEARLLFEAWSENVREFVSVCREMARKRSEKFIPVKVHSVHVDLQERLEFLYNFRVQHEQLVSTIQKVVGQNNENKSPVAAQELGLSNDALEKVNLAIQELQNVDCLDLTQEGSDSWIRAEQAYNEKIASTEHQIISRLTSCLSNCQNASEMFRVFSRFNSLFIRPKIRGAVHEYQSVLIDRVKEEFKKLHDKFMSKYQDGSISLHSADKQSNNQKDSLLFATARDMPLLTACLHWTRGMSTNLNSLVKKVEQVLGSGWEQYAEGQSLLKYSQALHRLLDTTPLVQSWIKEQIARPVISGPIFKVKTIKTLNGNRFELGVNFHTDSIMIFKDIRNLLWMGISVPATLQNIAKDSKRVYPFAVAIDETLRIYKKTLGRLDDAEASLSQSADFKKVTPRILMAEFHSAVQNYLSKGVHMTWDFFINTYETKNLATSENRHIVFVRDLSKSILLFQEKTDLILKHVEELNNLIDQLNVIVYQQNNFCDCMESIQKIIDQLDFEGVSNLKVWISAINSRIESILIIRLKEAITEFNKGDWFKKNLERLVCRLKIQNQQLFLEPSLSCAKAAWISRFHDWIGIICKLKRIRVIGAQVTNLTSNQMISLTYSGLLTEISQDQLMKSYTIIHELYQTVFKYVDKWLQYQSLWDMQPSLVYENLGDSLEYWMSTLNDLQKERSIFDSSKSEYLFDGVIIQYGGVQAKVNEKYVTWQRNILTEFSRKVEQEMNNFFETIKKARSDLEIPFAGSSKGLVPLVSLVQQTEHDSYILQNRIDVLKNCQKVLESHRFAFPESWLFLDQVIGEWQAFTEILSKKSKFIVGQKPLLCDCVLKDEAELNEKISKSLIDWEAVKPVNDQTTPSQSLDILERYFKLFSSLHSEYETLVQARKSLEMDCASIDRISCIISEIEDLSEVWTALSIIWKKLDLLKSTMWISDDVLIMKKSLDNLDHDLKKMPNKLRQYIAFQSLQEKVEKYGRIHTKCLSLKSESLRERHWNKILITVESSKIFKMLRVGDIWENDAFQTKEKVIEEIIVLAQGEMSIETFLSQVESIWSVYNFDFVNFQNKCRLIRGWDDLFNKCQDHLAALTAMKTSIYFKAFQERALRLESSLNQLFSLLEVWVRVQKQWIYLQGVFAGNLEVRQILPMESNRFISIDTEFMNMMRKIYKAPLVFDTLAIPNIQPSMQRLNDLLHGIQKSLGEYLERERSNFPRFYFLSDEDLLEILGNARDFSRIQPHLKKMFSSLSSIKVDDNGLAVGFSSKEQEYVCFSQPFNFDPCQRVYQWLESIEMSSKASLRFYVQESLKDIGSVFFEGNVIVESVSKWISSFPGQILILSLQIKWTEMVETLFRVKKCDLCPLIDHLSAAVKVLATTVVFNNEAISRKKYESLLTELIYQRDSTIMLQKNISNKLFNTFQWESLMRFYLESSDVRIKIGNSSFLYGFEYLGVPDRLVQTPLTDRCYLTLTQALANGFGGSPFGPAGTGKTESVKALAIQLGRQCLVFCCDESFDFQSIGRIFLGLCKVGAWGCFDEFNRLEEAMLSAVSQQVQTIQNGLKSRSEIEIVGRSLTVNPSSGIFITMNPGYAGRSELPDNLTSLFRPVAMNTPDRLLIAQVLLYSQGFRSGDLLAKKVVPFFDVCQMQLSCQRHYDFGLRALKSVLIAAGRLQRSNIQRDNSSQNEFQLLIRSIRETIFPKLVKEDYIVANKLLKDVFGNLNPTDRSEMKMLLDCIRDVCDKHFLVPDSLWLEKLLQIYTIQDIHHGIMIVGPSGSGKTAAWKVLFKALEKIEKSNGVCHIIEPKSVSKESLYGFLDSTTREWTDGIFTKILRDIIDNSKGASSKRHWIIFDGEVDPEWIENLNSVLDDNKTLTLPNGERMPLPPNVRLLFEVSNVDQATPATVSRCGMVWFPESLVTESMISFKYLSMFQKIPVEDIPSSVFDFRIENVFSSVTECQKLLAERLEKMLVLDGLLETCIKKALISRHIMRFSCIQALDNLYALVRSYIRKILDYNASHPDFPLSNEQAVSFFSKSVSVAIGWAFGGDMLLSDREAFGKYIVSSSIASDISKIDSTFDADPELASGDWQFWQSLVPTLTLDSSCLTRPDLIIPTADTLRHESVLYSLLSEKRSLILCGPPGSGKTMTLLSSLRKIPECDVIPLNFSSETSHDIIIKTLEIHGRYEKSCNGESLAPKSSGRWLVLFCDEINLPKPDQYGNQRVISLLRQLIEQKGFWRRDGVWISIERIQIIGACNPPTDPGRVELNDRFLRHSSVVYVDYPGEDSLLTIYATLTKAVLQTHPNLRHASESVAQGLVRFYLEAKSKFNIDDQSHYIYSPRELTRWVRGIYEIVKCAEYISFTDLVRIWAHECLRLFKDRLVHPSEKLLLDKILRDIASMYFSEVDLDECLREPILFSNFLSRNYESVKREDIAAFIQDKLQVFYEEELDKPLVLFDAALDHILRIDRVLRQTQGHMLLIGISGSGKSTLTKFVSWINGLSVFQPSMHAKYSISDFDDDLKIILKRSGCKGERICFLLDESNIMDSSFLERMNTLLANSEIPGLFGGDELNALMNACKEASLREGLSLDSHDELYAWFSKQVAKNLHVVFTMNPSTQMNQKTTSSPALFNRCVLNWMGDWDFQAFYHVGKEFTLAIDMDKQFFSFPKHYSPKFALIDQPYSSRDIVLDMLIFVHVTAKQQLSMANKKFGLKTHVTPRQFLDFASTATKLYLEKRNNLEERQRHLVNGLDRLNETLAKVEELQAALGKKKLALETKSAEANEKLQKMVQDQQIAENKRNISLSMQKSLEEKNAQIAERKLKVQTELSQAEPAVIEAQESVSSIKKNHLTELRSMGNPPNAVKMTMEAVCILLGHKVDSWKSVQAILRKDDFISSIVNYETSKLTHFIRKEISGNYLMDPNFTFETANRASKACGPLLNWVAAQVVYANILEKVEPLRAEMIQLEESALSTKLEADAVDVMVVSLEQSINVYKEEYAVLISDVQLLKREMEIVKERVDRSVKVLNDLDSERIRWNEASESFGSQMSSLVGDTLLCSAYLSYCGVLDQSNRSYLFKKWKTRLDESSIVYQQNLSIPEYLILDDTRRQWLNHGLPSDNLCLENAVMLETSNQYPLIIDPSGQALEFLKSYYKRQNIVVTSFLDASFLKTLESALRFGNVILIQDAEQYDCILNPILLKEIRKSGGRNLVRVGNKDIDFSPNFRLFLMTKNSSQHFSPDISSRVSFVNFTITHGSLSLQCLARFLKSERPDIELKRKDLLKMQGEFQYKLHHLEKSLLTSLNESTGNILDDDKVLSSLESLKKEATEIGKQVAETDNILLEVELVTSIFEPLAEKTASIYFAINRLRSLKYFYCYSLEHFFEIFDSTLKLKTTASQADRLEKLEKYMFCNQFQSISSSLFHQDTLLFGLLLAQIRLGNETKNYWNLFSSSTIVSTKNNIASDGGLKSIFGEIAGDRLENLVASNMGYSKLISEMKNNSKSWKIVLESPQPESLCLSLMKSYDPALSPFDALAVLFAFRPDRFAEASIHYLKELFGQDFMAVNDDQNITGFVQEIWKPAFMISEKGHDISYRIEKIADASNQRLYAIAMGSPENIQQADATLIQASRTGTWLLIKNAHLALSWLVSLDKKLSGMTKKDPKFRLFITCEVHPSLPVNLIRSSKLLLFESATGVKYCAHQSFASIPKSVQLSNPLEKGRLLLMLSWLHAVITERSKYIPIGWSKKYDFSHADFELGVSVIDSWLNQASSGRANISPEKMPWDALQNLISYHIYGSKIDSKMDQHVLDTLTKQILCVESFNSDFILVSKKGAIPAIATPSGTKWDQYLDWIHDLPEEASPHWIGLSPDADLLLKEQEVNSILKNLKSFQALLDENQVHNMSNGATPEKFRSWLRIIPEHSVSWSLDIKTPVDQFFYDEFIKCQNSLTLMKENLKELISFFAGEAFMTHQLRDVLQALETHQVPLHWIDDKSKFFSASLQFSIDSFLELISNRWKKLVDISQKGFSSIDLKEISDPEAFLIATRQLSAYSMEISLEHLELECSILPKSSQSLKSKTPTYIITGLQLQGAKWLLERHRLELFDGVSLTSLPSLSITWCDISTRSNSLLKSPKVMLPVYLNISRDRMLMNLSIPEANLHLCSAADLILRSVSAFA